MPNIDLPTIPVVTSPYHQGHAPRVEVQCGRPIAAFDLVARMDSIHNALAGDHRINMVEPQIGLAVDEMIRRVHDQELVDFLAQAWEQGHSPCDDLDLLFADTFAHRGLHAPHSRRKAAHQAGALGQYCFDTITGVGPNTFEAAAGSVATAVTAAGHVARGAPLALGLCRPPGHHVSADAFGGGCYLNNAAISAQWLRDQGADKVAIVDIDFHHGNGTQAIFYDRADVFYTSLHGHPDRCYPYFTGYAEETGTGDGRDTTLNLPFGPEIDGAAYGKLIDRALSAVSSYSPAVVVVSLGFDTYRGDPAGDAALDTTDYFSVGQAFSGLGIPTVAVLEGGYSVPDLGSNVRAWLSGAAGDTAFEGG
ncbi:MAG: histone deacetylase family protein [Mycobacterium sp.]